VLLLDNSAWARVIQGIVPRARATVIATWMEAQEIAVCLPFLLEVGFSARSLADRKAHLSRFDQLPHVRIDTEVERLASEAQRELTEIGHHRLAPVDLMIAACADRAEAGVLHYDADYDILAERTSLVFESEWLAPQGTL
jgi:predicted nucleic acid-binding protein